MIVSGHRKFRARSTAAFTLIEVMIVVAIIGILSATAGTRYSEYVEKARVVRVITELRGIALLLDGTSFDGGTLPETLIEIDAASIRDPWGNPYQYLRIEGDLPSEMADAADDGLPPVAASPTGNSGGAGGEPPGGGGATAIALARKDRFLVPINSDYDLYSMGPDGDSMPALQTQVSRDDIIRASDGAFYGIAENF